MSPLICLLRPQRRPRAREMLISYTLLGLSEHLKVTVAYPFRVCILVLIIRILQISAVETADSQSKRQADDMDDREEDVAESEADETHGGGECVVALLDNMINNTRECSNYRVEDLLIYREAVGRQSTRSR